jgi:hypothetical protein
MKHIHAELMRQYAEDAMETDKPWERWQFSAEGEPWEDIACMNPSWQPEWQYRRKPRTIRIVEQSPAPTDAPKTLWDEYRMAVITGLLARPNGERMDWHDILKTSISYADHCMKDRPRMKP